MNAWRKRLRPAPAIAPNSATEIQARQKTADEPLSADPATNGGPVLKNRKPAITAAYPR